MPSVAATLARLHARPIAHRGLHGCGASGPVENTIAAARSAIDAGYGIECDIQLSRDGVAMVFHDDRLDRLTGAAGALSDRDAGDLAALRLADGSEIPTLATFLSAIAGKTPVVVEIKADGGGDLRLAEAALVAVRGYAGPIALESFDPLVVAHCRDAPCPIGLIGPAERDGPVAPLPARCDFVSWNIDDLATATARHPGLPLTTWTVRTEAQHTLAARHGAQIVFEGFRP